MTSLPVKIRPKLFVNDLNVQRFLGIFSAHYCWPEECEQNLEPKCWSQVMIRSYDWFVSHLFPNVTKNLPKIVSNEEKVQQINELMFGLILKELDLLSLSQMQYFEAIIDLFNDEITFGVIFWLKLCSQFNWRLNYAKQVVRHRNRNLRHIIESIFDEIESKKTDQCFTEEDISYFYSIVDCICVQLLANNVVNKSSDENQFLVDIRLKCLSQLYRLNYDPFVRQLTTFNVLTQELIGFSFKLFRSDCINEEDIQKQIKELGELFTNFTENSEFNRNITIVSRGMIGDIAIAKDNQKSLQLVDRQYFLNYNSHLFMDSMQTFFESFESNSENMLPSNTYSCLSDILGDKQNPDCKQLIEILISYADFETFGPLLTSIRAEDIIDFDLALKLSKRVIQTNSDPKTKTCLTTLLLDALKLWPNIDLKSRLKYLKLNKIIEPNTDVIKTLFNQMTRDDINSVLFDELSHELLIAIYLNPFSVYQMIMELALYHNRAQTGLVAKIISNDLYYLSKYQMSEESDSFIVKFIYHLLIDKPSIKLIEDMTKLIQQIVNCPINDDLEPVLSLDELFLSLVKNQTEMKSEIIYLKLNLIKNLIELSADQSWSVIDANPVPTIVFLLQFLEYFWENPVRKQFVIDILDLILDKKMSRNLTEEELSALSELLEKWFRFDSGKASTHRIYLAYCEKRFPKPIEQVIDITKKIYHDQILYFAVITPDFMWICRTYPRYEDFNADIKIALNYILPSLTTKEFYKLFKFLQMYYYNHIVVSYLRTAIFTINKNVDKKQLINCLMDIVTNEILTPMRSETLDRPLTFEDFDFIRKDLCIIFKSMATFDYQMLPNDMTHRLKDILSELCQRMIFESINGYDFYEDDNNIPEIAKSLFKQYFGDKSVTDCEDSDQLMVNLPPAGLPINLNKSVHNSDVEQTVCE